MELNGDHHSRMLPKVYQGYQDRGRRRTSMIRLLTLAAFAVVLASPATAGGCVLSYCKGETSTPSTREIRSNWESGRQRLGDLYDPGRGRRIQIRNNQRVIIGYITKDGSITNARRQPVANIEALRD